MTRTCTIIWLVIGALIALQAGFWFLAEKHETHTTFRNMLVIIQAIAGFGLMYWSVRNKPGSRT